MSPNVERESSTTSLDGSQKTLEGSVSDKSDLKKPQDVEKHGVNEQETSVEGDADSDVPPRNIHGYLWIMVVFSIYSSTFLFALDNTIVANIQPAIIESLHGIEKLPWSGVAFVMASSATVLSWLQIYNQFNIKWLYILSFLIFQGGSAMCGAAPSMNILIGGRVICGIGGVGQYVGVMNFFPRLCTMRELSIYMGGMGITWGMGTVLGPIIGGAFTDSSAGWRWSFYINLCVGAVFAPVYLFLLPSLEPQPESKSTKERLSRLDFLGTFLLMGAFAAGVIGVNFAGVLYAWNSAGIIIALVFGALLFVVFGIQQYFCVLTTTEDRLFPVECISMKSPLLTMLFICGCCTGVCVTVPTYIVPLFFQFTAGDQSLQSGVRLLPFVCLLVFSCVASGFLLSVIPYYTPWYMAGGALCLIGSSLLYTIRADSSFGAVYSYTAIIGLGAGMYLQLGHSVAAAAVEPAKVPRAVAFTTCAQLNGLTFALSIAQCVFANEAIKRIGWVLPGAPHEEIVSAISGTGSSFVATLDTVTQRQIVSAIIDATSRTYILCIVAGALTLIMSFFMKWERLFMTASGGA